MIFNLFIAAFGALIGAVGFRLKGDAIFAQVTGRGATTARLACVALPLGLLAGFSGVPYWFGPAVALAAFLGSTVGTFGAIDAGRIGGERLKKVALNTLRGFLLGAPVALVCYFANRDFWYVALGPIWCGAHYEIAWALRNENEKPTELAELLVGGALGGGLAIAAYWEYLA